MPLNLASPGILVREVDLTIGRVDTTTDKIGGIVGPFAQGPVNVPTQITSENELVSIFGKPYDTDKHYETWLVASSYLAYGGQLSVVRADDFNSTSGVGLKNAFVGTAASVRIQSNANYEELGYGENPITNVTVVAKDPGSWADGVRVAVIDGAADQTVTIDAAIGAMTVGYGITQAIDPANNVISGAGGTSIIDGHLKGIVTKFSTTSLDVKVISHVSADGTETAVEYSDVYKFGKVGNAFFHAVGAASQSASAGVDKAIDWFDQQTLVTTTATVGGATTETTVKWNTVADKPGTSSYGSARGARFDEVHVVLLDGKGKITGNPGTVLEKHLSLSKAKDAEFSVGSPSYWRKYLETNSEYIYGGTGAVIGVTTTGYDGTSFTKFGDGGWDQPAENIIFNSSGTQNLELKGGKNYGGVSVLTGDNSTGALDSGLDDILTGYSKFENDTTVDVDFLLMGSGKYGKDKTRALAQKLIAVAELRKDAVAFISPYRAAILADNPSQDAPTVLDDDTITSNVTSYYSPITSTTYGVFDSGYKYMYDRFNNAFRYVPLNGDIAGCCARTDINDFPWFSPAGTDRGTILNAVKLPYNPTKLQRDALYSNRINPVIHSAGSGIILFGDKTGFAKSSAFDRINVRRLFIYLEDAISAAAKDQLFEFNDEITRSNFVNIVEPFLRDVQAKRGIQDYVVICDETNNTAAVIDSNEFIADIYIKPARSINFIGLTFIATRTGVSFEEVIGKV